VSVIRGRGFLLLPAAAFAVHQLRYTIAYGSHASGVLAAQGHSYLDSLAPWVVLLLGLGAGLFTVRVARALSSGGHVGRRRSFAGLWALTSGSLVAIYVVQELLEGYFAVGHPAGVAGVLGHGGWWALVVAPLVGALVAALLRFAHAIVSVAGRTAVRRAFLGLRPLRVRPWAVSLVPRAPLAYAAAGRAPPAA
jgi:hypothetical protein